MTKRVGTSLRLEAEALKRADALVTALRRVPELTALGTLTRSKVLRLAIARGLAVLERESKRRKS